VLTYQKIFTILMFDFFCFKKNKKYFQKK